MQIDWLTVAAQIVNFLVLVWLLKRFLYGPVIKAMHQREQRIQSRLESAAQKELQAQQEAERYSSQQAELHGQREEILAHARQQAGEIRHRLKQEAKAEVDAQRHRWLQEMHMERTELLTDIHRKMSRHVAQATRRTLSELASAELEAQMVEVFLKRLQALDAGERKQLAEALSGEDQVVVSSAFELPSALRDRIEAAATELLGRSIQTRYEQVSELTCGLEMAVAGRAIGWNVTEYLADLEQDLESSLRPASGES